MKILSRLLERMGAPLVIGKLGKSYNVRELLGAVFTETELSQLTRKVDRLYEMTETIDRKQDQQWEHGKS